MKKRFRIVCTPLGYRIQKKVLGLFWVFYKEPTINSCTRGWYKTKMHYTYESLEQAEDSVSHISRQGILKYGKYRIQWWHGEPFGQYVVLNVRERDFKHNYVYTLADPSLWQLRAQLDLIDHRRQAHRERNKILEVYTKTQIL